MTEWMTYESFVGLPVARRGDEVETTLNSRVLDQLPTYARLRVQVVLELGIHVVDYRLPAEEDKPPDRRDFLSQLFGQKTGLTNARCSRRRRILAYRRS